jgi:hypothetical protein
MTKVDPRLIEGAASSVEGLLRLLVDGLDWPIPQDVDLLDDADLLLEWDPAELQLDPSELGSLTAIRQIAPLTTGQPFGVFVLTFEGGRLPIGALRRVVRQLVRRRRRKHVDNPTWELGDLLFFCHSDDGQGYLHIVAMRDDNDGPTLRTISWSSSPTATRRTLLSEYTLPDLCWPEPGTPVDEWRQQWRGAFTGGYRQGVRTADQLSQRMAEVAADIRDEITDLLAVETSDGALHVLLSSMQERLDAGISEATFGNVFAQTLVYGLLSARVSHPGKFEAAEGHALLDFENPFLDAVYGTLRDHADDSLDLDHLGLTDLAHTLAVSDIDSLLADFGTRDRRDDPVIYLYEEFLARYDKEERQRLGAYYTPVPLVDAIIRLTDHELRANVGLVDGIASRTTWGEWAAAQGLSVPEGIDRESPVLQVLDPATGTGTFLLRWMRAAKQLRPGAEAENLENLAAIELSLASYAVAHLKLSLELPEDVRDTARLPVYLADTLAGERSQHLTGLEDAIAAETAEAQRIKFRRPATVIIGNPPYDRIARDAGGGWVLHPESGQPDLFADILDPAVEHTIFSYVTNLYNLYVYFWRWAIWKAFEQCAASPAVVTFVTASSWLDGPGFLGLRRLAREIADSISVIDLGGDNKGGRPDENVFGIETPVAIVSLVRRGVSDRSTPAAVRFFSIQGTKAEKLARLEAWDPTDTDWQPVTGDWFAPLRPPTGSPDWHLYPALADLLPWQQPGCMFNRTWPVAPHPELLIQRWDRFTQTDDPDDRASCFVTGNSGRNIHTSVAGYLRLVDEPIGADSQPIIAYGYRSFDRQWTFDDPRLAKTDSPSLWASQSPDQLFMVTTMTQALTSGPGAALFTSVPDKHAYRGSEGGKDVIPLFRDRHGTPNCDPAILRVIGELQRSVPPSAEDLFAYCYAVLAGTWYTERFQEELETPGPRIPLSADQRLFSEMVAHGERLINLHTDSLRFADRSIDLAMADVQWRREPSEPPKTTRDCVYEPSTEVLHVGDGELTGVTPDVWDFAVSGMPVLRKWLGYRTSKGAGRAASSVSPLDKVRPVQWYAEWSIELVELVGRIHFTLALQSQGDQILQRILAGPLISSDELPQPDAKFRAVPKATRHPDAAQGSLL